MPLCKDDEPSEWELGSVAIGPMNKISPHLFLCKGNSATIDSVILRPQKYVPFDNTSVQMRGFELF